MLCRFQKYNFHREGMPQFLGGTGGKLGESGEKWHFFGKAPPISLIFFREVERLIGDIFWVLDLIESLPVKW